MKAEINTVRNGFLGAEWMAIEPDLDFNDYYELIDFLKEETKDHFEDSQLSWQIGNDYLIEENEENEDVQTLYRLV